MQVLVLWDEYGSVQTSRLIDPLGVPRRKLVVSGKWYASIKLARAERGKQLQGAESEIKIRENGKVRVFDFRRDKSLNSSYWL
uniref:Uncharacterized protein n=2 Tax=viral metagenome TaxID=1070528 RepID=A0A6M3IQC4_9ZZZZ